MKLFFSLISLLLTSPVLAANVFQDAGTKLKDTGVSENSIVSSQSLPERIGITVSFLLSIVGVLLLVNVIYAGFQWTISKGNPETIKKARNTIIYSIVGMIIVIAAYAIAQYITTLYLYAQLPE